MTLTESVKTILSQTGALTPRFYDRFFDQVPDARAFFETTNMQHQAAVLRMALQMVEQFFTHGYGGIGEYLRVIGFKHRERGIPQELYTGWKETLLDTLQEFHGHEWNDSLAAEWTGALDRSIDKMLEGYRLSSAAI